MRIETSTIVERPLATVWDFCIVHHVENHPRWDPTVELDAPDGPLEVGTVIVRRTERFGTTTEGTMEVTGLEPMRSMHVRTQDGPMRIDGWMLFEAVDDATTKFTRGGAFPDIDEATAAGIRTMMAESGEVVKALIESET